MTVHRSTLKNQLSGGWRIVLLGVALIAVFALAIACGDDDDDTTPDPSETRAATDAPTESAPATTEAPVPLSKTDVVLHHSFSPSGQHVPLYMALEKGFFADEGLNVEIKSGGGSGDVLGVLASGQIDFAYVGSDTAMTLIRQGAPVKSVLNIWARHPAALVALPGAKLDTPKDLEGKTLLEESASGQDIRNKIFMEKNGVDASKVDIQTLGQVEGADALLLTGRVDVIQTFINSNSITLELEVGEKLPTLLMADWGVNTVSRGIFVNQSMIDDHADTIAAFNRAIVRAYLYTRDNLDEATQTFVEEFPEQEADIVRAQVAATLDLSDFDNFGFHDADRFTETESLLIDGGSLDEPADDVGVYFTNEFVPN